MHQLNYHMWNFRLSFNRLHKPTDRIRFIFVTGECFKALKMKRNLLDKYSVSLDDSWEHLPLVNDDQTLGQFHQVEHNSNKSFCRSELRGEIHKTRMSYIKTSITIYSRILTNIHSSTISDKTGGKEHFEIYWSQWVKCDWKEGLYFVTLFFYESINLSVCYLIWLSHGGEYYKYGRLGGAWTNCGVRKGRGCR